LSEPCNNLGRLLLATECGGMATPARVLAVQGDTAIVEEPNNLAFGRPVEWRLALASLTRVGHP
jgi:hypothetical protein